MSGSRKKDFAGAALVAMFVVGLALTLYPTLANYRNAQTQSRAVVTYTQSVETLAAAGADAFAAAFAEADAYNAALAALPHPFALCEDVPGYEAALDVGGTGVMGYLSIEKIGVELPVYHGTSAEVLTRAVGHVQGSSLPVGGAGTHAVVSAHRGLPAARLFTDVAKLEVGDTFTVTVLDRVLMYRVDQVLIVEPDDVSALCVVPGKDYCTLLTCTPYGVNSHRLLVRGERVDAADVGAPGAALYVANEAYRIDPLLVAPVIAAPMLCVALVVLLVRSKPRRARTGGGVVRGSGGGANGEGCSVGEVK